MCLSLLGFPQKSAQFNLSLMNVVYVGVENPIQVYNFKKGDSLKAPEGVAIDYKEEPGEFLIIPKKLFKTLELKVLNKKGKVKSVIKLNVKRLPSPVPNVLGHKQGLISKGKLKLIRKVDVSTPNVPFQVNNVVKSFVLTINSNGKLQSIKNNGNKLTVQSKMALSSLD